LDAYYRDNPKLIVTKDKDVISTKRPMKYALVQGQGADLHQTSSVGKDEDIQTSYHVE
jgi:hypothetical protein